MNFGHSIFSFGMMLLAVIAAYLLFRTNPRHSVIARGPVLLVCVLFAFQLGLSDLPLAIPAAFQRVLGHSVWINYLPPPKINVTQVGGTWWLVRWRDPIQSAYFFAFLAGMIWAGVNVFQRRQWKINVMCLSFGAVLIVASVVISVTCFPFCF